MIKKRAQYYWETCLLHCIIITVCIFKFRYNAASPLHVAIKSNDVITHVFFISFFTKDIL